MRTLQVIVVFILVVHQSYQHHIPSWNHDQLEADSAPTYDDSLKPGIYRLALDRSENPSYKWRPETKHTNEEINKNRVYLREGDNRDESHPGEHSPSKTHTPEWMTKSRMEEDHYRTDEVYDDQQEDKKRIVSMRSSAYTKNPQDDKKRSVSVKSKAYDEDYDNQQMDKKRSVSVRSAYDDEVLSYRRHNQRSSHEGDKHEDMERRTYNDKTHQYEQNFGKQHEHDDEEEVYRHVYTRSLVPSFETDDLQNTLLKKMTEKLRTHQSVSVTLREIHQIVRESQKQIWYQVVKMFPGGEMAQAMVRAQKENLFAGLAFNPFKMNVKGTNIDNGMPGSNTVFPVPQGGISGPLGMFLNPQQPKINTEAKQEGVYNPRGYFGSQN